MFVRFSGNRHLHAFAQRSFRPSFTLVHNETFTIYLTFLFSSSICLAAENLSTIAEQSNFQKTGRYEEVETSAVISEKLS
jgi:hypothetical protein